MLTAFEDTVLKEVKAGGSVDLMKLASFSSKVRPARTGRNPITGEPVEIPEKRVPAIKAHKPLKEACNL
ncbi:MAG: HU family DNA-binding protein [Oscillibacter ruminantium]|nr:HU family DNA-binding protein [Oscillibacter ruminantium]MEA5042224.1 HU family DNA-binding protein [Oscillibacter ruminantium]